MLAVELNKKAKIYLRRPWFEFVAGNFARAHGLKGSWYFSLAFVDSKTVKRLNRDYRGKDKITDVLSFAEEKDGFIEYGKSNYLGEIVICVDRAKRQAKEYNYTLKQEIARLLVHGLAHLVGFDHENVTAKEAEKMFTFEKKVMKMIGEHKL